MPGPVDFPNTTGVSPGWDASHPGWEFQAQKASSHFPRAGRGFDKDEG